MSLRKMMILVAATMLLLPVSKAKGQDSITCSDIEWSSAVTDEYPGIKDACVDAIARNGNVMAKIKLKIIDMNSDDITFRFVQPDGTLSGVYRTAANPNWVESIHAAMLNSKRLGFGMTMNAYATVERWSAIIAGESSPNLAEETKSIEIRGAVTESEPAPEVKSVTVMPDTEDP